MSTVPSPSSPTPSAQEPKTPTSSSSMAPMPNVGQVSAAKTASYQLPPSLPSPPPPPVGFVKPIMFPPMKDRLHRTVIRFRASLGLFVLVSALAFLPPSLTAAFQIRLPILPAIAVGIISFLFSLLVPYLTIAIAAGELDFGKAAIRGLRSILPGIVSLLVAGLVMILPTFVVIPAIILSVRFMLILHVVVNERRTGVEALARSRDLIFGRSATLFFDQLGLSVAGGIAALLLAGIAAGATWAIRPAFVPQAATLAAGLFFALYYPFYVIYLQTFYEDCVAVVGKNWTAAPSRKLLYRVLAVLGLLSMVAIFSLPAYFLTKAKFKLGDLGKLNINATFGNQSGEPENAMPLTAPPTYASTPEDRDLARYGDVNMIKLALGSWFNDTKSYPDSLDLLVPKYLKTLPKDPDGSAYGYQKQDLTYVISFSLEQGIYVYPKGPHTLTANGFDVVPQPTPVPPEDKTTVTSVPPTEQPTPPPPPPSPLPQPPEPQESTAPPADTDGDGLTDEQELVYSTRPDIADTDGDGLSDGEEVYVYATDPRNPDTDGDGFSDTSEIEKGYDPKGPGALTAQQKAQYDANLQTFHAN